MKKAEIKVGSLYYAKVGSNMTTVRVNAIREVNSPFSGTPNKTVYDVTNIKTQRKTVFHSASKFRHEVHPEESHLKVFSEQSTPVSSSKVGYFGEEKDPMAEEPEEQSEQEEEEEELMKEVKPNTSLASKLHKSLTSASRSSRKVGTLVTGMVPNEEQELIIAAAEKYPQVLVVCAGAGTGKTATLKILEQILKGRGQYTAFNAPLVAESKTKFIKAKCNTTHSLAYGAIGYLYKHRLGGDRMRSYQIAKILGIEPMVVLIQGMGEADEHGIPTNKIKTIQADFLAGQVIVAIRRFCQSADRTITLNHFGWIDGIDMVKEVEEDGFITHRRGRENNDKIQEYLLPFCEKAWVDICDTEGRLNFNHDYYVKIWALGEGKNSPVIDANYIMVDECFPAGTIINTDKGRISIEVICEKQGEWRVLSSIDGGKTVHYTKVTSAYKTPTATPLVRIKHEHGEIVCTANHPLWIIGRGWVAAGMATSGDSLSHLQEANSSKTEVLLSCMRSEVEGGSQKSSNRSSQKGKDKSTHENCAYRDTKSNEASGGEGETISHDESKGRCILEVSRGQRSRTNSMRAITIQGASPTPMDLALESRVCRLEWTTKERISDLLQNRHSFTHEKDCSGGRRRFSPTLKSEGERPQKDNNTTVSRVVSVQVQEPRNRGECQSSSNQDNQYVYTLSTKAGTYFANRILVKNCQDTAPVFLDILEKQTHAMLVVVGDENQEIYAWRGTCNAMKAFPNAPRCLLSQSYRFGQTIADVANSVLATLDEPTDLVMRGMPTIPSRVAEVESPHCYLYRTNAGAVSRVINAIGEGKKPHLIGGGEEVVRWCQAAIDLQTGKKTSHPELCCFDNWKEVVKYSKTNEGDDLRLMVKLVEQFGAEQIRDALKDMVDEKDADLVVSTAHKSKGKEWDTVKLGSDFPTVNKMGDADRRLLYVALTRARLILDISECSPFCGGQDKEGQSIPGIEVKYTIPMPSQEELEDYINSRVNFVNKVETDKLAKNPRHYDHQKEEVIDNTNEEVSDNTPFTWANLEDKWCVRGPKNVPSGERVTVVRKDGTTSQVTLRSVVRKLDDLWFYGV